MAGPLGKVKKEAIEAHVVDLQMVSLCNYSYPITKSVIANKRAENQSGVTIHRYFFLLV